MSAMPDNALITDVIAILTAFAAQPRSLSVTQRRQRAVESVADQALGRFRNHASALYSLRDACTRRLGLGTVALDEMLAAWERGNPEQLREVLEHVPGARSHWREIEGLLR